ncbi:MAG TPA: aldo/keto reductase [Stellaceae bacterium]|nr:aldo/keto reductase [Stellaceae bacterium]
MERRKLGQLEVSAIGLGCATMTPFYAEPDPVSAVETIRRAPELGIDLLDTSDAYGNGRNEELVGRAIDGRRGEYVIASKFGNLRRSDGTPTADGRPEYVKAACERSLGRLHTDVIDLYYIHRVDPTVPIEDTVGAMSELISDGKVRFLGISEAGPQTIRRAHATHPMSAVQIEYSLWTRDVEREILGLCSELDIGFVAYSPLGRGFLTGTVTHRNHLQPGDARLRMPRFQEDNLSHNLTLVAELQRLAGSEGCTPAQLALAWVLSRGRFIVPIAGTSRRRWLEENAAAAEIRISASTASAVEQIFRPGAAAGARYPDLFARTLGI